MIPARLRRFLTSKVLCIIVLGGAILALVVYGLLIRDQYSRLDQLKAQELKAALTDSVRGLNREPAIEPTTGRQFIPGYHLVLPADTESFLYYRNGSTNAGLWFISPSNQLQAVNRVRTAPDLKATFEQVSVLQQCSRQVLVSFNTANPKDSDDKLTLHTTKKLKDGRTAYLSYNQCPFGPEPLLRSVEQLESF